MTRVYPIRRQPHRASALDRSRIIRKKKPYKVVLEAVTQERKKLHSFTTYRENAPPGYVFVPVGHPDLTEYCKDRCREWNLDAIIVSAKPRSKALENTEKISHHVHRLGFHFPAQVISEACDVLGYKYRNNHFYKRARDLDLANTRLARSLATHGERALLHGRPATEAESKTQVRDAVRDLFPKIPEQDLSAIVHHAFAEGSTRVGNAKELTLARRVQLAVVAHIRHTYTEYDSLLKTGSWSEARSKVEHVSLAVLRRWRDEGDDVEETFREVIVIDDDDDDEEESSDDDDEDFFSEADQREHSLEIISSRATARELQLNEPEHPVRVDAHGVGRAQRRIIYLSTQPVSRPYVVAGAPNAYPTNQESRAHARPLLPIAPIRYSPQYPALHNRPVVSPSKNPVYARVPRPQPPLQMRGEDGQLYNLQLIQEHDSTPRMQGANNPRRVEYVPSPSRGYAPSHHRVNSLDSNHRSRFATAAPSRRPSEQDVVLPSVEREPERVMYDRVEDRAPLPMGQIPIHREGDRFAPLRPLPAATLSHEDVQSRPRMQAQHYEVVDLTSSSPIRPPQGRDRASYVAPVRAYRSAVPVSYSQDPAQYRRSPYEYPATGTSRTRQYALPTMSEGPRLRRDYPLVTAESQRFQAAFDGRATRSGLLYGGYTTH